MALLTILGILLVALVVIVPLVEKFGPRMSGEELRKYTRFILPIVAIALMLQGLVFLFRG